MKLARCVVLLALAGCHASAPVQSVANVAPAPVKLGPKITGDELTARLADHRLRPVDAERLEDSPADTTSASAPAVRVDGDVISALACRPGGVMPALVADAHYVYVTFARGQVSVPLGPDGRAMPIPSTYCSFQRFRIPGGLAFGGTLEIAGPT
jgi:hypothetical protein